MTSAAIALAFGLAFAVAQATDAPSFPAASARPESAGTESPASPRGDDAAAAVIENSGSTNALGYTISLFPTGDATVRRGAVVSQRSVPLAQTRWLFARLAAAGALGDLGSAHCMKSASFGTRTTVAWHGVTSGDLSCRPGPAAIELSRTIGAIVERLDLGTPPRRPMLVP